MSFIDLMANDRWTETDILNRTEAMLRSQFSVQAETILNRKISGAMLGQYELNAAEMQEMGAFAAASLAARQEGVQARLDMALLNEVFLLEEAQAIVDRGVVELTLSEDDPPIVLNQEEVDASTLAVMAAQVVIDGSSVEAKARALLRAPASIEEPIQEPIE